MSLRKLIAGVLAPLFLAGAAVAAEPTPLVVYGVQVEEFEGRLNDDDEILAWDFDASTGTDALKIVWRSEAELEIGAWEFETLENQFRLATPISPFFDAIAGARLETPEGDRRVDGVIGLHGLAEQWVEVDLDLFVSDDPSLRFEAEYEGLITNRITLTPSIEVELPFTDDADRNFGAFAPTLEVGARLSYDLVDRLLSPYIGIHYEIAFGESGDRTKAEGGKRDEIFFVVGTRILF